MGRERSPMIVTNKTPYLVFHGLDADVAMAQAEAALADPAINEWDWAPGDKKNLCILLLNNVRTFAIKCGYCGKCAFAVGGGYEDGELIMQGETEPSPTCPIGVAGKQLGGAMGAEPVWMTLEDLRAIITPSTELS